MSEEAPSTNTTSGEEFLRASEYLRTLPSDIPMSNDQKLRSYGLFKQATIGNVNTERPGFFNQVNRAKWDAWKECEGLSAAEAEAAYIQLIDEISPAWRG